MRGIISGLIMTLALHGLTWANAGAPTANTDRQCIEITVTGFVTCEGAAMISVVNSRHMYENGGYFRRIKCPVVKNRTVFNLNDLPAGEYAVKVFHDENGNGELDTRMFGIPKEAYGFSNNARGKFGPPDYTDAVIQYSGGYLPIVIKVQ